ncbi:MAG: hemerythrin domain-containing protein [Bdellovibrionia bacterium]
MTPVLATQILRDDHKRLTGLFRQIEAVDQRAHVMKNGVALEIFMEIEIHSAVEEQIFYPALIAALNAPSERPGDRSGHHPVHKMKVELNAAMIDQSISDHREIEGLIQRLRRLPIDSTDFREGMEELEQLITSHIEEEEQLTFPAAEELLKEELSPLGAQIQDMRDDLLRQPQYADSRPEVVQNPNGGEQMRTTSGFNVA